MPYVTVRLGKNLRSVLFMICILSLASALTGCMPKEKTVEIEDAPGVPLPPFGQIRAIKKETEKEYLEALRYWKYADGVINKRLVSLVERVKKISENHLQNGVEYYLEKKGDAARHEFIEALRFDPLNVVALDYLKQRYEASRFILHTVQEGDTAETIAENVYGTFTSAFVVSYFSDLEKDSNLTAGMVLQLPLLDSFYSQALLDYKQDIVEARKLFNEKKYEELLPFAEHILQHHPGDREASYLVNISLVRIGNKLRDSEKFEDAADILSRVDPAFKNVKKSIKEIRELQKEKLERDAQQLNAKLFRKGESLYAQGKYLEALEVFRKVDPEFEEVSKAVAGAREKLKIQAETHYREGVKLFLDENLAGAIAEWEETLRFHPGHLEALNYIDKARKSLKKFKEIN